jgi:hypothetical protein
VTELDPVQRLLAIEEIKHLKARYFRLLDTKRWDEWGEVFTAGCVMEVPEADMVSRGRDEIVQGVSAVMQATTSVHHGHMPEIDVTGPDRARGTWAMDDYVEWPRKDGTSQGFRAYGHYHEEYAREDGTWRIARIRLERLRMDPFGG